MYSEKIKVFHEVVVSMLFWIIVCMHVCVCVCVCVCVKQAPYRLVQIVDVAMATDKAVFQGERGETSRLLNHKSWLRANFNHIPLEAWCSLISKVGILQKQTVTRCSMLCNFQILSPQTFLFLDETLCVHVQYYASHVAL